MKEKEQSSIEWLIEQIEQHILTTGSISPTVLSKFKKQAKKIRKKEIIEARLTAPPINPNEKMAFKKEAEQYYNEKYSQ